jgi:hypothetical protein
MFVVSLRPVVTVRIYCEDWDTFFTMPISTLLCAPIAGSHNSSRNHRHASSFLTKTGNVFRQPVRLPSLLHYVVTGHLSVSVFVLQTSS